MSTDPDPLQLTIMHNMTEMTATSDYWNPELLSQSLLGIWFAASHQPWMNLHFVILELCARQEWQVLLRQELKQHVPLSYETLERLPLLDGFIKETVRLNPLDTRMCRLVKCYHPSPPVMDSRADRINSCHPQKSIGAVYLLRWQIVRPG